MFVVTGVLESMERDDAKSLIERYGGKVTGNVSKKTTYLVRGRDSGVSKLEKVTTSCSITPGVHVAAGDGSSRSFVFIVALLCSGGELWDQDPGRGPTAGADQNQTREEVQVRDRCRGRGQSPPPARVPFDLCLW